MPPSSASPSVVGEHIEIPLSRIAMPRPIPMQRRRNNMTPQEAIDEFWSSFTTKKPGKATSVIPPFNSYADIVAKKSLRPQATSTQASYDEAAAMCRAKVDKIVKECRRINKKYRDPHFDIEADLKLGRRDCLQSINNRPDTKEPPGHDLRPRSVRRVGDIFDNPQFYIEGPTANDVRQGRDGDCWLMAALCTLSNMNGLIEKLCVAHDPDVGVYGFVFHRDGEWISEIVDDFLYLTKPDYDEQHLDRILFDDIERIDPEDAYRKIYQSNSASLYFAQCQHPQETWLPLLEKAYAKAHGDYAAIEGGFGGEGIEDLTGGVTSEVHSSDILDKERFWNDELLKVNQDFLFGCSTGVWGLGWGERKGIYELHAYSIQKAVEIDGKRLLKLKNPWGKGEWKGPWSDGSKEWTPEWLQKLDHRFGDDGDFWIEYKDLLRKYQAFERTRLFGPEWRVTQVWTTLSVPWTLDYHDTHFCFTLNKPGPVVIVLSQLDDRYFRGLEGQYLFELGFRVHKAGQEDYLVRSQAPYRMRRSANVELDLEAGDYEVRVRIDATRLEKVLPTDDVVRDNAKERRDKLIRIGLAYDLAHSKGRVVDTEEEKAAKEAYEKKEKDKSRAEMRETIITIREEDYYLARRQHDRQKRRILKRREKQKARQDSRRAKMEQMEREEYERREAAFQEAEKRDAEQRDAERSKSIEPSGSFPPDEADEQKDSDKKVNGVENSNPADAEEKDAPHSSQPAASKVKEDENASPSPAGGGEPKNDDTEPFPDVQDEPQKGQGDTPQTEEKEAEKEPESGKPKVSEGSSEKQKAAAETTQSVPVITTTQEDGLENHKPEVDEAIDLTDAASVPRDGSRHVDEGSRNENVAEVLSDVEYRRFDPRFDPRFDTGFDVPPHEPRFERRLERRDSRFHPRMAHRGPRVDPRMEHRGPRYEPVVIRDPPGHPNPRPERRVMVCESDSGDDLSSFSDLSEIDERELEIKVSAELARPRVIRGRSRSVQRVMEDDGPDDSERDPWNAVAVVALRVYHKAATDDEDKENTVRLKVARSNPYIDDDDETDEMSADKDGGESKTKGLDVDDSAKDATLKGGVRERKKSILGDGRSRKVM